MLEHVTRSEIDFLHDKSVLGHGVDFVGIINKQGRMVDYVCKNEINLSNEKKEMFFMGISLQMSMQKDYDGELGHLRYVVSERDNSKVISIPILTGAIVIIMKKSAHHFAFIKKVLNKIRNVKSLNFDSESKESLEHIRY
jgi:hypothetical protein